MFEICPNDNRLIDDMIHPVKADKSEGVIPWGSPQEGPPREAPHPPRDPPESPKKLKKYLKKLLKNILKMF